MGALKYILVFGFLALMGFHYQEDETIAWNAKSRLSWKDFRGKVPVTARASAITASGITYRFSTSGTQNDFHVDFQIDTHFYPDKSWYQPELCDTITLSHEQLHFDISELYARKFKQRLAKTTLTHENVKAKVRAIYREINEELNDFQNQYDDETNFSRNHEQQLIWNEKIKNALEN